MLNLYSFTSKKFSRWFKSGIYFSERLLLFALKSALFLFRATLCDILTCKIFRMKKIYVQWLWDYLCFRKKSILKDLIRIRSCVLRFYLFFYFFILFQSNLFIWLSFATIDMKRSIDNFFYSSANLQWLKDFCMRFDLDRFFWLLF